MQHLHKMLFLAIFASISFVVSAQSSTEVIPVSGNCGMCKSTIEKAAKQAGATSASWDKDSKKLTVSYNSESTNTGKIQKGIAAAGYDTRDVKASDAAYDKLHGCCKYDRNAATKAPAAKCEMKDGKCVCPEACKAEKACCQDGSACKDKGCCDPAKKEAGHGDHAKAASCCKPGAATAATDGKSAQNSCCSAAH